MKLIIQSLLAHFSTRRHPAPKSQPPKANCPQPTTQCERPIANGQEPTANPTVLVNLFLTLTSN